MDSSVFSFSDIKKFVIDKKYYFISVFLISFSFVACIILSRQVRYVAKGSFFEDTQKTQTIGNLKDILLSDSYMQTSDAFSFFKTNELNKKLIQKLGLQINIIDDKSKLHKLKQNISNNLKLFFNKKIDNQEIVEFSDVFYENDEPAFFYIKFLNNGSFKIFDSNCQFLTKNNLYEHVRTKDFSFTITDVPKQFINQLIKIRVDPFIEVVNFFKQNIEITKDKNSSNYLILKVKYFNKLYAEKILNTLMNLYRDHLIRENDSFIKNQIAYLEKRKSDLEEELLSLMEENEKQTGINVRTKGFYYLNTEVTTLLTKRDNYQRLLDQVTKELDSLKQIDLEDIGKNIYADENILKIIDEIKKNQTKKLALLISIDEDLKTNTDLFLINKTFFQAGSFFNEDENDHNFLKKMNYSDNGCISKMIFDSNLFSFFTFKKLNFKNDNKDIAKIAELKANEKKISILDLNNLKDLYLQLDKSKDDVMLENAQIRYLLDKIKSKDFQVSNISVFLPFELIKNLMEISKKIGDEQNYTLKEIEALKLEYEIEKKYLITHLQELLNLKNLYLKFLDKKLFSLKKMQVNILSNEISFLTNKAKDLISKNIYEKTNEKIILERNLLATKTDLQNLVVKISQENKLKMKAELTKNMMDSITKLIESKKLDLNLKQINSKPIDLATVSMVLINPFRNSFIIAFLIVFFFFITHLYLSLLKGMPLSKETIKSLGFDFCGEISNKCSGLEVKEIKNNDLESLRKIIVSIEDFKHIIITCIASKGPNFLHYLAALLAISGKKVLVIETKSSIEEKDGLFTFLEQNNDKLPIQKLQAYDYLPSGEKKYFAFELLKSSKFLEKLQQIKSKYDLILIYSDASINSAEARIYLDFSDKVILSVRKETLEEIKTFTDWAKENKKLSFVTY